MAEPYAALPNGAQPKLPRCQAGLVPKRMGDPKPELGYYPGWCPRCGAFVATVNVLGKRVTPSHPQKPKRSRNADVTPKPRTSRRRATE